MENKKLGVQSGLLAYIFWGVLGVFGNLCILYLQWTFYPTELSGQC